jgi:hypothetical protein
MTATAGGILAGLIAVLVAGTARIDLAALSIYAAAVVVLLSPPARPLRLFVHKTR